jgi:hypothetical protein
MFPEYGRGFRLRPMTDPRTMSGPEFEAALLRLAAGAALVNNLGCLACERCERCRESTFCVQSRGLARCHYCAGCQDCVDCSHCASCQGCSACQYCALSENCIGCAYLVQSTGCTGCSYCFGCVGLSRRDFWILNEPFDRATYFAVTGRLARELRIALP